MNDPNLKVVDREPACGKCTNFDRIVAGTEKANHGWCMPLSKYPHTEQLGQSFPPGVSRAGPGELASPAIRRVDQVVPACPHRQVR